MLQRSGRLCLQSMLRICEIWLPLLRRGPVLSCTDIPPARLHRQGRRSAGALSKRAEHWRSRCDSLPDKLSEDNLHDADDSVAVVRDEIVQETSRETTNRWSRQSGPPTLCIEDTVSLFV